jgi:hypothetical protein
MSGAVQDAYAGECRGGRHLNSTAAGRFSHRWGKAEAGARGIAWSIAKQCCVRCRRVRIIKYGKRGNHVVGYEWRA